MKKELEYLGLFEGEKMYGNEAAKRMSEWAQLQYERAEGMEFQQSMNDLRRRKNPLNFFERIICVFLPEYPREV